MLFVCGSIDEKNVLFWVHVTSNSTIPGAGAVLLNKPQQLDINLSWHLLQQKSRIVSCYFPIFPFQQNPLEGQTSKWLVVPRWNQQHHVPGVELVVFVTNEVRRKRHCYNLVTSQNPRIFLGEEDGKVVRKNGWCFRNPAKQLRER